MLFAGLLESNQVLSVDEILVGDSTRMDSISRAVFDASAAAFLKTLLQQDSGAQRVEAVLRGIPQHEGSQRELLLKYFPMLAQSERSLEKWWALEVATMSQRSAIDYLGLEKTEGRLDEALKVRFLGEEPRGLLLFFRKSDPEESEAEGVGTPVVCGLGEFERFIDRKDRSELVAPVELKLQILNVHAHPLYREILTEYRRLARRVSEGKKRGLRKQFDALQENREQLRDHLRSITDYLNWFEATQITEKSGDFEEYQRTLDRLRRDQPSRTDPISRFMDRIEQEANERRRTGGPGRPGGFPGEE
jgi:hypothetical protein